MVFHIDLTCVSQFLSQSLDLLLEDETHSTNCYGHTSKCHCDWSALKKGSAQDNLAFYSLVKIKAFKQYSWKKDTKYERDLKPLKGKGKNI